MKTLVIHPQDSTTDFLSFIYAGRNWDVITTNVSKSYLKSQIKSHDRIIMLGHGDEKGLDGFSRIVIDSGFVYLLREKNCVCIWCKADEFVDKYGLKGFYTGMIISEVDEANMYFINTTEEELLQSNLLFVNAVRYAIEDSDILGTMKRLYDSKNSLSDVIKFNQQNLFYKDDVEKTQFNGKTFINMRIRIRQDSSLSAPTYTEGEIIEKLVANKVKFEKNESGTIFLCDTEKTNKIIGVIE